LVEGEVLRGVAVDLGQGHVMVGKRVPPAGLRADGPASDQRVSSGMLVIEGSFEVASPGGGA
jgi:hypothetical protein